MPLPAQLAKIEVRFASALNIQQECVLWYAPDAAIPQEDGSDEVNDLAFAADATVYLAVKGVLGEDAEYLGCHVHLDLNGNTFLALGAVNAGLGTVESPTQAENVAVVLRKRTTHGGKSGRGRWFMGCVPESLSDTGKLTTTGMTAYQALADAFQEIIVTTRANYGPRLISRHDNTAYPIVAATAQQYTRSQRRRLVRIVS